MITTTTPHNTTSPQSTFWFSGNICAVLVLVRPKLKDCFHQVIIDGGFLTFQHNSIHVTTSVFASVFMFSEIRFRRLKKFRARYLSFQLLIALAFFDTLYIICGGINYTFRFLYIKVISFEYMQTFRLQNQFCQVFLFFFQGL